jgi:hypothetical protein
LSEGGHRSSAAQGRLDEGGIVFEEPNDFIAGRKPIRVRSLVDIAWQLQGPVRELKGQCVPSLAPPSFCDAVSLKDDVLSTVLAQMIAHGQPGLAATDDSSMETVAAHRRSGRGLLQRCEPVIRLAC